jgi:hypothetical protein
MRITSWIAGLGLCLLAACAPPAEVPPPDIQASAPVAPAPAPAPASVALELTYVVLTDPGSDSPFRWDPVLAEGTHARAEGEVVWAPAAPVVAVLDPGARVEFESGKLRIDDVVVAVPARDENGVAWADVTALARHFGALAYRNPQQQSVTIWTGPMLRWLIANGELQPWVLKQAGEVGLIEPLPATPLAATALLRVRNTGPDAAQSLRVRFPVGEVPFGDVRANSTTAYRQVPGGVYGYAAYRLRVDGRDVSVPVIDWVGETPLEGSAFTYVVTVDAGAQRPVIKVRVERDR